MKRNKKYRMVTVTLPIFVLEKIAGGDRDELVDYLNHKLYNSPEFFECIMRDDVWVSSDSVMGQFEV